MAPAPSLVRRVGPNAAVVLVGVGLLALAAHFLMSSDTAPKKRVTETVVIKLIQPPPPPSPPPPKIERPPEPAKLVEQTPIRQPEIKPIDRPKELPKQAVEPPPGPLGLDTAGVGPGDAFGMAGRPGGASLVGGGGGGSRFGSYASLLQAQIQRQLHNNERLATSQYRLVCKLWINDAGKVDRVELVNSSGRPEIDSLVKDTVASMPAFQPPPPKDMPQPIVIGTSAHAQREG